MIAARNRFSKALVVAWCMVALLVIAGNSLSAQAAAGPANSGPSQSQLERWLKQYPAADANRDGVLTRAEAEAYRRRLVEQRSKKLKPAESQRDYTTEFTYATMADGVKIALAVAYPKGFDPQDTTRKWPAVLHMSGYPSAVEPGSPGRYGHKYVMVNASVRGSGASGGLISVISAGTGMDGYEIIENWIVKQPWSSGKVAVEGHSWSGLTGFTIAAADPPHLRAVAVSGLFDDVYRGIGRIGGIRNSGFPVNWMNSLYKPTGVFGSDEAAIRLRGISDEEHRRILASRPPRDLANEMLWRGLTMTEDGLQWRQRSPGTYADGVRAPIYIMHAYQDQQTGPSGAWLWKQVADDVPKRLVLTNGHHGMPKFFPSDRQQWFDFWLLGNGKDDPSGLTDPQRRVRVYFETTEGGSGDGRINEPLVSGDFPLPETIWSRYYFHQRNTLSPTPPSDAAPDTPAAGDSYRVVVGVDDDQIDGVHYAMSFDKPTAICGPIVATFWATCTTLDTDFFVLLADIDRDGYAQYLQRGMLRASHRALDEDHSDWVTADGQGLLVRPRHPHRDPAPLVPGKPYHFDIEVFPVGHVFRQGHSLAVRISQPPFADPVAYSPQGQPSYTYESAQPPGTVTILRDADHPSSILLPILPELPPISDQPPAPGSQAGIRRVKIDW